MHTYIQRTEIKDAKFYFMLFLVELQNYDYGLCVGVVGDDVCKMLCPVLGPYN